MATAPDDLTDLYESKTVTYATFGNGVVLDAARRLLPAGGRVLDVGCASGGLIALLREQAGYAAGIEIAPAAAAEAARVADDVHVGGIEDAPFEPGSFDLVVFADVLEHLVDPEAALRRGVDLLRPGGAAAVSVPNIAHWRCRLTVARGLWPADDSGPFDASHLHCYTDERLTGLMRAGGLRDVELTPVTPRLRNHVPAVSRLPGTLQGKVEAAWQAAGRRRPNLMGYQLVATGRRP